MQRTHHDTLNSVQAQGKPSANCLPFFPYNEKRCICTRASPRLQKKAPVTMWPDTTTPLQALGSKTWRLAQSCHQLIAVLTQLYR